MSYQALALLTLEIQDFRCIQHARIAFDPKCSVIVGANAAGKTSVLESIFALSRGRSFKTPNLLTAIRNGEHQFSLSAELEAYGGRKRAIVQFSKNEREIRFDGERSLGFAEVAAALPVVAIDPGTHKLLEEGPTLRREFIDWGTFHVERTFINVWRNYQRALAHRNAALKQSHSIELLGGWNAQLSAAGNEVSRLRECYLETLRPYALRYAHDLLNIPVSLNYLPGWNSELSLELALEKSLARDQATGSTTVGPHRADLVVEVGGVPARYRISRGQQKLLAGALTLAQLHCHAELLGRPACLLLDDPAAELDVENLGKFLDVLSDVPAQMVMAALDGSKISDHMEAAMFHVEQGVVTQVV